MGRGKIEINKIQNAYSRQVTFCKRRAGLLKKAQELSILCDAEVAVIMFSYTGKLFEFSSSEMEQTLLRYKRYRGSEDIPEVVREEVVSCQMQDANEVDILKEEIARLRTRQLWSQGKELSELSLDELHQLENKLNDELLSVKGTKDLQMQQLNKLKMHEQEVILENSALPNQVEMLRLPIPFAQQFAPPFLEYPLIDRLDFHLKHDVGNASLEAANCNSSTDKESLDTALHLEYLDKY